MITPRLCLALQVLVSTIISSTDAVIETLVIVPSEQEQENENASMLVPLSSSLANSLSSVGSLKHTGASYVDDLTEDETSSVKSSLYDGSVLEIKRTAPDEMHQTSGKGRKKKSKRGRRRNGQKKSGEGRTKPRSNRMRACVTKYTYGVLTRAMDIFGEEVTVTPNIPVDEKFIDQYFHESFCDTEKSKCHGAGPGVAKSSCETTYRYAYARAVKGGHVGWWMIRLRSGCSCIMRKKMQEVNDFYNVLELIR